MLAQMALLPVYLWLFMGSELADIVEPGPFLEAFVLLIVLPLALAWATEAWAARSPAAARLKRAVDLTPVALMALTLLVVVASQFPRVRDDIDQVRGRGAALRGVPGGHGARRACAGAARCGSTRRRGGRWCSPARRATRWWCCRSRWRSATSTRSTAAVIVTQTLVEVLGMVAYVRVVPRLVPAGRRVAAS